MSTPEDPPHHFSHLPQHTKRSKLIIGGTHSLAFIFAGPDFHRGFCTFRLSRPRRAPHVFARACSAGPAYWTAWFQLQRQRRQLPRRDTSRSTRTLARRGKRGASYPITFSCRTRMHVCRKSFMSVLLTKNERIRARNERGALIRKPFLRQRPPAAPFDMYDSVVQ